MQRVLLVLLVLFPFAVTAEEMNPGPMKNQSTATPSAPGNASATGNKASRQVDTGTEGLSANTPQQPRAKANQPAKPRDKRKPKIAQSIVGYVDDAIVDSQVRIRFDSGFGVNVPDRSEFFYAKCGCYAFPPAKGTPDADNAPGLGPGGSNHLNFQQLYLQLEYAPTSRFSVFTEVPFRLLQPQSFLTSLLGKPIPQNGQLFTTNGDTTGGSPLPNPSGISDVRAGFKVALVSSSSHSLTLQFRSYFPSGNVGLGVGTGHYSVEPSLLYYQKLSGRMAIESQLGDWHPIGGSAGVPTASSSGFAGDVFFYGFGPSYEVYRSERVRFAPVIEMFGWHVLSGFQTVPTAPPSNNAGGTNIVNLKVGARTSIGRSSSVYVGLGKRLPTQFGTSTLSEPNTVIRFERSNQTKSLSAEVQNDGYRPSRFFAAEYHSNRGHCRAGCCRTVVRTSIGEPGSSNPHPGFFFAIVPGREPFEQTFLFPRAKCFN